MAGEDGVHWHDPLNWSHDRLPHSEARSSPSGTQPPYSGNASLLVEGNLTNEGAVRLVSQSIDFNRPCCGGAVVSLEIADGYELTNLSTVISQFPPHNIRIGDIRHSLLGDLVNEGIVDIEYPVVFTGASDAQLGGMIRFGRYTKAGVETAPSLRITETNHFYDGAAIAGLSSSAIVSDQQFK